MQKRMLENNRGLSPVIYSSMTYGSVLKPKKGYSYQLKASYIEGIYNLEILEKRKGKKNRQLETYHYNQYKS